MSPKQRSVQHRSTSDERSKTKEIVELKRENHKLKRQVSRLRKDLDKYESYKPSEPEPAMEEMPEPTLAEVPVLDASKCPSCSSENYLYSIPIPTGILKGCKGCGWRKKEDNVS